jgi:cytochrome c oxidase assembly factor CtaG
VILPASFAFPLADALPPPLRGGQFVATDIEVLPVVLILGAAVLYGWGVARANRLHPRHPWSVGRTVAFYGGLLTTAIAVMSFIGVYDGVLFWDHMIQHLILIMVAPPLLAIGAPLRLTLNATIGDAHRWVVRGLRSKVAQLLGHPVFAFLVYALIIPLTHLTSFFNYLLTNEPLRDIEQLLYLIVGYLFWRQIFDGEPNRYRLQPGMKMLLLFLAVPVDTFTGLSLTSLTHEPFPAYAAMHRTWGPSLLLDLHTGGAIMWVGGDSLMMLALIPLAIQWMRLEERRGERADRELDEAWPEPEPEPLTQGSPPRFDRLGDTSIGNTS